jgi:hypothetical protein
MLFIIIKYALPIGAIIIAVIVYSLIKIASEYDEGENHEHS